MEADCVAIDSLSAFLQMRFGCFKPGMSSLLKGRGQGTTGDLIPSFFKLPAKLFFGFPRHRLAGASAGAVNPPTAKSKTNPPYSRDGLFPALGASLVWAILVARATNLTSPPHTHHVTSLPASTLSRSASGHTFHLRLADPEA